MSRVQWKKAKENLKNFIMSGLATFPPIHLARDRCYDFRNIFAKEIGGKNQRFWLNLLLNLTKTLVFEKNGNFFADWQKSPKIVIITSTLGSLV
jgi:hypothetical protein